MAKSVQSSMNQYNFAGSEESRPDAQLKMLSPNFFWMRHCSRKTIKSWRHLFAPNLDCCPLIKIFCCRKLSNFVNNLYELALKLVYQENKSTLKELLNPFHATDFFLYPLKTSENHGFSDVFRGYRKRPVTWNGLRRVEACANSALTTRG